MANVNVDVPRATVELIYNNKNVGRDLRPYFEGLSYIDHLQGESDELHVDLFALDDRWMNAWYPAKGDTLTASIGFMDGLLQCGTFTIDEITLNGRHRITLSGLATGLSHQLRTKRSKAFDGTTLKSMADFYAHRHGLKLMGTLPDLPIDRVSQYFESDLAFLQRIGREYGFMFSIKKGRLLFSEIAQLRSIKAGLIITPEMLNADWTYSDKVHEVYKAVEHARHNPHKHHTVKHKKQATGVTTASNDVLRINKTANNVGTAHIKSQAALDHFNIEQTKFTLPFKQGDTRIVSGLAVDLQQFGVLSGLYQIDTATHTVNRDSGYATSGESKRIDRLPVLSKNQQSKRTA